MLIAVIDLIKPEVIKINPQSPFLRKGKPFTRANFHEFLSIFLVEDDTCEDSDIGIEDEIEVN